MAAQPLAYPSGGPGDGRGVSGPANVVAPPRPTPLQVQGTQSGPLPKALRDAWRAYNGLFDEGNAGPLNVQPGVPDLNVRSNRIQPIVNTGVDFLFGPLLSLTTGEDEEAQELLDAVWGDDDERMTLLSKAAINGGVYGHVFVKVVPPKKGTPSADNPPRLVLLNPETVSIETDPDDADLVLRFVIEYACLDAATKAPMRKRQTVTRLDPDGDDDSTATGMDQDTTWLIEDFVAQGQTGNNWQRVGEARSWEYEYPPIIDWQNYPNPNEHWGQRDVTDSLVALNRQLRLVESNINKIGFLQGHPYLFAVGAETAGLKPTPGEILDLGAPDAEIKAVNASGDLQQLMAFAEAIRSDMDEESGVPGVALGRLKDAPRGQLSGITMRLLHASILARNEHKRRLYGQGIRQVCKTLLCLCGYPVDEAEALEIELHWQDPLPNDDLAQAQAAQTLQDIGYSQHTLILRTNGDPELEEQYRQQEQQQQMLAFSHGTGQPPMDAGALNASAQMDDESSGEGEDEENDTTTTTNSTTAGREEQPTQQQPQQNTTPPRGKNARNRKKNRNRGQGQGQGQQQQQQMPMQMPPLNHPEAQAARQKAAVVMKAAFGKR